MTEAAHAPERSERRRARGKPFWRGLLGVAGWTVVGAYFLFAAMVIALRYWVLPDIGAHAQTIEAAISRAIGERVTIGNLRARWHGLHPEIDLQNVLVHDGENRVALRLPSVEAVIGWRSLLTGRLSLHSLAIEQPDLAVRRDSAGRLYVAGLEIKPAQGGERGAAEWLLAQREIVVRDARITWDDQMRAAPLLDLSGLTLLLRNSGNWHRFGLRAQTSRELASGLDIRGELVGAGPDRLSEWRGLVYAELDHVDLAAWQRWVDYPVEVGSGTGAMRTWFTFDSGRVTELTADVQLGKVRGRVASHLSPLDLEMLDGRIGYRETPRGLEVQGRRLALRTTRGVEMPPADFALSWERVGDAARGSAKASSGAVRAPAETQRGRFQASSLSLAPLVQLAEHLPFPAEVRARLAEARPRGVLNDVQLTWSGTEKSLDRYTLRARFERLGLTRHRGFGGFEGLTGSIDANEASGSARIASERAMLDLPGVLAEDRLNLDRLAAQLAWTRRPDQVEVRFSNVSAAGRDLTATASGSYSTRRNHPDSAGTLDLSVQVERIDGRAISRYIPGIAPGFSEFLNSAVLAGTASDVRVRLKGDLHDFPYAKPGLGTFEVRARLNGVDFQFDPAWPRIAGFTGDLAIDGPRLTLSAVRGTILGARMAGVRAIVPNYYGDDEILLIDGAMEGPTAEFLRFIETSPVGGYIGQATRGLSATGNGRLALKLELPLDRPNDAKLSGSYQFYANQILLDRDLPPLVQVTGRLDFTDSGVSARGISAQFLDGPATFGFATRSDGRVAILAQGSSSVQSFARLADLGPLLRYASGTTPWRASLLVRGETVDLSIESTLQGVALALPAPLAKTAAEVLPLRIDRGTSAESEAARRARATRLPPGGDVIVVSAGKLVNAVLVRKREGERWALDRGAVAINEAAALPERAGLAFRASLATLDTERWRALLDAQGAAGDSMLSTVSLDVGELDVSGKRIHELRLRATSAGGGWGASVSAREFAGTVAWRPEGRGRIVARLKHLTLPGDSPAGAAAPADGSGDLPALDVVAESFSTQTRKLGRLELTATHRGRDWKIEKLGLDLGDATLSGDGVWQSWAQRPSISLNMKLDVIDVGAFMGQFGYPGTMKGGSARLEGRLGWVGSPQSIDYPTLTGDLKLEATKGQFLKADPGVARLLGILSMQSWVTLDFRNVFGEGFAYDSISANASVAKGVLSTEDFAMRGRSALVTMAGTVDLARETQALRVRVVPSVGDGVSSMAGLALANPVTGIGAMLLQRLLKDPLGQIFAYEYQVTGTWTEPRVERAAAEKPAPNAPGNSP